MQPDWETKTASDGQQETANPFAPIDYTSRLQRAVTPTGHSAAPQPPRPGQLYGGLSPLRSMTDSHPPEQQPSFSSAPSAQEIPSYLKKQPLPKRSAGTAHEPQVSSRQPEMEALFSMRPEASANPSAVPPAGGETVSAHRRRRSERGRTQKTPESAPPDAEWLNLPPVPAMYAWDGFAPARPQAESGASPFEGSPSPVSWPPPDGFSLPDGPDSGTPYAAMHFEPPVAAPQQPEATPRTEDEIAAFFGEGPDPGRDEPAYNLSAYNQEEPPETPLPFRDAFAPAAQVSQPQAEPLRDPYEPAQGSAQPVKPSKPPIRVWRVAALIAAAAMLTFCGVVGVRTLLELSRNERDMQAVKADYLKKTGYELQSDASRVDLLPAGQTFQPTATPTAPPQLQTPTSEPIIPINEAAIASLNHRDQSQVQEAAPATEPPPLRSRETSYPDNPMLNVEESLKPLMQDNPDVVGRLTIDGLLDEVVVQRDHIYYLTHDSQGNYSAAGAVFMDENCSLKIPPENLLLRGQSDVETKTFGPLRRFATEGPGFAGSFSFATLTTLYEQGRYRLFAVITTASDPAQAGYFSYSSYPTFGSDSEMLQYVEQLKSRSLYNFNVDVNAGDRLLTLATVGSGDTCVVLVYRRVRSGE